MGSRSLLHTPQLIELGICRLFFYNFLGRFLGFSLENQRNGQINGVCDSTLRNATPYYQSTKVQQDNHILQEVSDNPYLGLQISNDLKWSIHINNVCKKANELGDRLLV
jgi:hypothetical protein